MWGWGPISKTSRLGNPGTTAHKFNATPRSPEQIAERQDTEMKSVEFCYWLQGLFEVAEPQTLNAKQVDLIKRHLNMVFVHEIDAAYPAEQQDALNAAHEGKDDQAPTSAFPAQPVMRC